MDRYIDYTPEMKIANLESLPAGTGARYLVVIASIYPGEYIAKAWKHTPPRNVARGETIIRF